jgi:hypothetical protein
VDSEFRERAEMLLETYKRYAIWMDRERLFQEMADLNRRIRKCNEIWRKYAFE